MRIIGLQTEDPRAYFEMLEALREQGLKFVTLEFGDPTPANVGVIITTERERTRVDFDRIVTDDNPDDAISRAKRMLAHDIEAKDLLIGIDPGATPGVAVLRGGTVVVRSLAPTPESVGSMVEEIAEEYPDARITVRIGNGDRTNRNRIFNMLWDDGHTVEIVDERNTTKRSQTPDEDAAVEIAMTPGYRPKKRQEVEPCAGEIRNIQRLSRLESCGSLTVSKDLAKKVAMGEMSLKDAIDFQRSGRNSSG